MILFFQYNLQLTQLNRRIQRWKKSDRFYHTINNGFTIFLYQFSQVMIHRNYKCILTLLVAISAFIVIQAEYLGPPILIYVFKPLTMVFIILIARLLNLSTYFAAQWLIALSLVILTLPGQLPFLDCLILCCLLYGFSLPLKSEMRVLSLL